MSFTNRIVDAVYVINLDKDTHRMEKIHRQLAEQKIQYTRFSAVLGKEVQTSPYLSEACNQLCPDGLKGCALSHHSIWKDALEKGYTRIMILEDDTKLNSYFDRDLNHIWSQVPHDTDILWLGCNIKCEKDSFIPNTINRVMGHTPEQVDDNILATYGSAGTYTYIITSDAINKIVNKKINTHIDVQLQLWIAELNLKSYSVDPVLTDCNTDDSGLSDTFPNLLNSVLEHIYISRSYNLSWSLNENFLKIGPFNINILMTLLVFVLVFTPIRFYPYVLGWILIEGIFAKSPFQTLRYGLFLGAPMAFKVWFSLPPSARKIQRLVRLRL